MSVIADERSLTCADRTIAALGPVASVFTLAWLASHRGRLRTLLIGGRRLSVLVVWDSKGRAHTCCDDADVEAVRQLTFGSHYSPLVPSDESEARA